jgi:hypothetical protein
MIMGMMFSPSSRKGEKFGWNTWLSENDLHPSYVKNFILQKSQKLFFLLWFLSSFSCTPPPLKPLSRLTQKGGILQSEEVHLFASSGGARLVSLGRTGAKENPEPQQWDKNCQRLKLAKIHFSHCLFRQPQLTCPSVVCLPFCFDLHHRCYTRNKHAPVISTRYSTVYLSLLYYLR